MSESGIAKKLVLFPTSAARDTEAPGTEADAVAVLVDRVRSGDQAAFDELYQRFSGMVHGILLARVPREEVDDLVQDVFLTVLKKLNTLREERAFGGWLASIARNRAADHLRSAVRTQEISDESPATLAPVEEAREVLEVIKKLPDAYSETLVLRLVEGMTGPEIAKKTGLTPDSVRVNLHRGMKMLRKRLGIR